MGAGSHKERGSRARHRPPAKMRWGGALAALGAGEDRAAARALMRRKIRQDLV